MDIDEVMKETFSAILVDAKLERSIVIQVMAPLAHQAKVSSLHIPPVGRFDLAEARCPLSQGGIARF